MPSRGYDHLARVEMTEADDVEIPAQGAVSSFTVITPVRYYGQMETEPYIRGVDPPRRRRLSDLGVDVREHAGRDVRVGLRVRAVWRPEAERDVERLRQPAGRQLGAGHRTLGADG